MNPSFAVVPSRPDDERSHTELHTEESEGVGHLPEVFDGEDLEALSVADDGVHGEVVEPLLEEEGTLDAHDERVQEDLDDPADVTCQIESTSSVSKK